MGTMRRGGAGSRQSLSRTFSDPDCTSGSEVSCNTVIFMGGRTPAATFSDGDATDVEGRPPSVVSRPLTSAVLLSPRQQGADSGAMPAKQTIGNVRHGVRTMTSPLRHTDTSTSSCASPAHVSRKGHHHRNSSRSPMILRQKFERLRGMQELWVDGPVVQHVGVEPYRAWEHESFLSPAVLAPVAQQQTYGHLRHLKDMSAAAGAVAVSAVDASPRRYPVKEGPMEMWVDGPKEFLVQQQQATPVAGGGRVLSHKDVVMSPARRSVPVKSFVKSWVAKHGHLVQQQQQPGTADAAPTSPTYVDALPPTSRAQNTPSHAAMVRVPAVSPAHHRTSLTADCGQSMEKAASKSNERLLIVLQADNLLVASTESVYEREIEHSLADVSFASTFTSDDDGTLISKQSKRPSDPCSGDERRDRHIYEELDLVCASKADLSRGVTTDDKCLNCTPVRNITQPSCLRRPDGASNPNLTAVCHTSTNNKFQRVDDVTTTSGRQQQQMSSVVPVSSSSASSRHPSKGGLFVKAFSKKSSNKSPEKNSAAAPSKSAVKADKSSKQQQSAKENSKNESSKRSSSTSPVNCSDTHGQRGNAVVSGSSKASPTKSSSSSSKDSKTGGGDKGRAGERGAGVGGGKSSSSSRSSKGERRTGGGERSASCEAGRESDSGNDSGIVEMHHCISSQLLRSPYAKVTMPRLSQHSTSSGRGSDNSSTFSGQAACSTEAESTRIADVSSGYESLQQDGEVTGSLSSNESSASDRVTHDGSRSYKNKTLTGKLSTLLIKNMNISIYTVSVRGNKFTHLLFNT